MRRDDKHDRRRMAAEVRKEDAREPEESHVVFDFTGLRQTRVGDLSLILTARLKTAPEDNVWVRSIPPRTALVLRALGLDHLFRMYPEDEDELN